MNTRTVIALIVVLVPVTGCSRQASKVSEKAVLYCSGMVRELKQAADKYSEFAGWIAENKLDPGQRNRAESQLPYGATWEQRSLVGLELGRRMLFCASIRQGGTAATESTGTSFETFREKNDPQEVANAMIELAESAKKLSALAVED